MLILGPEFARHRLWAFSVVLLSLLAIGWYVNVARHAVYLPGGSSFVGLSLGIAGGLIIIFEFLIWPRKKVRAWRIFGSAQLWLRAHIWLGLLSVPLTVLHTGFTLGSPLSTILFLLYLAVIGSGIYGLWLQQVIPRKIMERVPAETIYSQLEYVAELQARDAEEMVVNLCGADPNRKLFNDDRVGGGAIRKFRQVGAVRGNVLQSRVATGTLVKGDSLRSAFYDVIADFLLNGRKSSSKLVDLVYSQQFFSTLRQGIEPEGQEAIDGLESLCDQRRQFDLQKKLHERLHRWLSIHLPLSAALVVLLFVHVYVALKYL